MGTKVYSEYKQGVFTPCNPSKYVGSFPIIYRSSLEYKVMCFFDRNSQVKKWGSESIVIKYFNPIKNKLCNYYTDFNVAIEDKDKKLYMYVIEVKPYKQTIAPTTHGNKKQQTVITEQTNYIVNNAKWEAARKWCDQHSCKFQIITELDIKNYIK